MNHQVESKHETEFLQEQVRDAGHKVARHQDALDACGDCLEIDTLRNQLQNAQMEYDLLQDLLKQQSAADAVSLEATIMRRVNQLHERTSQAAGRWQRGQPTPPAYWEAESQRALLLGTLCSYHAWQIDQTPKAAPAASAAPFDRAQAEAANGTPQDLQNGAHPWFDGEDPTPHKGAGTVWMLDELQEQIVKVLASAGYPEKHLEIMVQLEGLVVVTGQAHSAEEREQALAAIMAVENVWEIVSDIKVVDEARCSICHPAAPPPNGG